MSQTPKLNSCRAYRMRLSFLHVWRKSADSYPLRGLHSLFVSHIIPHALAYVC